jgi:hypothetical protein
MRVYQLGRELNRDDRSTARCLGLRYALYRIGAHVPCDLSLVNAKAVEQIRNGGHGTERSSMPVPDDRGMTPWEFIKAEPVLAHVPTDDFELAEDHLKNSRWTETNVSYRRALESTLRRAASQSITDPFHDLPFAALLSEQFERTKVLNRRECGLFRATYGFLSQAAHQRIDEPNALLACESVPALCCFLVEKCIALKASRR